MCQATYCHDPEERSNYSFKLCFFKDCRHADNLHEVLIFSLSLYTCLFQVMF